MKIPRYFSQEELPSRMPAAEMSQATAAIVPAAVAGLVAIPAKALTEYSDQFAQAQQQLAKQDAALDVATKLSLVKQDKTNYELELKSQGVDPDAYAPAIEQRIRQMTEYAASTLKYPETATHFRTQIQPWLAAETTKAKEAGFQQKLGLVKLTETTLATDLINQAIVAETPEQRQALLSNFVGMVATGVRRGVRSPDEGESMLKAGFAQLAEGDAILRARDPQQTNLVLAQLKLGRTPGLTFEKQQQIATHIETQQRAEETRIKAAVEEQRKIIIDAAQKDISDALTVKNWPQARAALVTHRELFTGPEYQAEESRIDVREHRKDDTPSDPATLRRLNSLALSPDSISNPRAVASQVQAAYDAGLIDDGDFQRLQGHTQGRIIALQNQATDRSLALLGHRSQRARELVKDLLTVPAGPMTMFLSAQAQNLTTMALEDLDRNDAYLNPGRGEDPLRYFERRKAFYVSQLSTVASERLHAIERGLRYPDLPTLMANERMFRNPAEFEDQLRLLRERQAITAERARLDEVAKRTGGSGAGGPSALPAAPTPGGRTLGY